MHFIFWVALLFNAGIPAAHPLVDTLKQNGIYFSSNDFVNNKLTLPFGRKDSMHFHFREPLFSHTILIKAKDTSYRFYYNDLWGYRRDGVDLRIWNDKAYHLSYNGKICLYDEDILTDKGKIHAVYFSTDLNKPIKEVTKRNLEEAYHGNTSFVKKLSSLKWYQSLYKKNKSTGLYRFIDWL